MKQFAVVNGTDVKIVKAASTDQALEQIRGTFGRTAEVYKMKRIVLNPRGSYKRRKVQTELDAINSLLTLLLKTKEANTGSTES